jgi:hypothetical protein
VVKRIIEAHKGRAWVTSAVHKYISQGVVSETLGGAGLTDYRRTNADPAAARARLESLAGDS